ncbi:MAG: hypothetical protein H0W68_00125 [Gemmatimonadaceae bacterium]|nr:hypothetical protein [Gemmatimonadaceae bacterium]
MQGASPDEAIVLVPGDDVAGMRGLDSVAHDAVLIGRGGARFTATLGAPSVGGSAECRLYGLRDLRGEDGAKGWAVGFLNALVSPTALDSIEVLSSRDSSALAAEASRLASTVTAASGASFQGLRFTAHDVRRFEAWPGVQALIAHLTRKVNQEANPQEEQTLLIAERDSGVTTGAYTLAFAERTHGLEEQIATSEVIAAARLGGTSRTTLVVARDGENGVAYALLERVGVRRWRVRWTSRPTRCS